MCSSSFGSPINVIPFKDITRLVKEGVNELWMIFVPKSKVDDVPGILLRNEILVIISDNLMHHFLLQDDLL